MSISNYLDSVARPFEGLAPWILRLVLGVSFILHGLGKFPLPPEKMVTWFESMGIVAPEIVASLVAVAALCCVHLPISRPVAAVAIAAPSCVRLDATRTSCS